MPTELTPKELQRASSILSQYFQQQGVTFGFIGGAGCSLIFMRYGQGYRGTTDLDVIIQTDSASQVTAESISADMYRSHHETFAKVDAGYGVFLPAVRITGDDGNEKLVEVEIFDYKDWPNRPQYDLSEPENNRIYLSVEQMQVAVLSPRWLLREKILSLHQRKGSQKAESDMLDIAGLIKLVEVNCLTFTSEEHIEALKYALSIVPVPREQFKDAIKCPEVFGN